ncbi:MAG: CPBP family intramembrane glutamic endopeptidase, partial [Bryobacteraceae bacterium]
RSTRSVAAVALGAAVFFAVVALGYVRRYSLPLVPALGIYFCFLGLVLLLLAAGFFSLRGAKAAIGLLFLPYLTYAAANGDFRLQALGKLVLLASVPIGIFLLFPVRQRNRLTWQDAIAWTWLMVPVVLRWETGIWTKPVNLDFMARLFTLGVAVWSWLVLRGTPGAGYRFSFTLSDMREGLKHFLLFAVIAVPLGLLLHLSGWNPRWQGFWKFCVDYVTIFLFIAWLEEFFFRGILQNLLQQTLQYKVLAQTVASIAFGLSHILLAPAPNWRYVILASIAGWFYGGLFAATGTLMAPAMMHALVDTVWRTWFGRGGGA